MNKFTVVIAIAIFSISAKPMLWSSAETAVKNGMHTPTSFSMDETVYSKSGKVVERSSLFISQKVAAGKVSYTFVSASEDGKTVQNKSDIEVLLEQFKEISQEDIEGAETNPLLHNVTEIEIQKESKNIETDSVGYTYHQPTKDGRWKGILYIHRKTGLPLSLKANLLDTPITEDGVKVKSLSLETNFGYINEQVTIKSTIYKSSIVIKEGILPVFKGTVHNKTTFNSTKSLKN